MTQDRSGGLVVRIVVATALVVLLAAAGLAAGAQQPSNRARARADATKQLAALVLPSGATEARTDPSKGSVLRPPFVPVSSPRYVIDDDGYWRVPGSPAAVASWIQAHPPAGADGSEGGSPSSGVDDFGFAFPYSSRVVLRALDVEVARAKGGGSAVRADGVAVWVPMHPSWERIPTSARLFTVTVNIDGARSRSVTFTDARAVARVAQIINGSAVVAPILEHCPHDYPISFRLVFRARRAGPVLARAGAYPTGCSGILVRIGGRQGPELVNGYKLARELVGIGAVPRCARRNLALDQPEISRWHGQHTAGFVLRDRGRAPCEVVGPSRVQLLDGTGHRVPLRLTYRHTRTPWLLAPANPATEFGAVLGVTWTRACRGNVVRSVHLKVREFQTPFVVRVASRHLTPCHASAFLTAFTL